MSLINEKHVPSTLHKVRQVLQLLMSVDWDSPMNGAEEGQQILFDEILEALTHSIDALEGTRLKGKS